MKPSHWPTEEELQETRRKGAEREGVSVEAYTEFIKAADEAMTLAFNWRRLQRIRAEFGI